MAESAESIFVRAFHASVLPQHTKLNRHTPHSPLSHGFLHPLTQHSRSVGRGNQRPFITSALARAMKVSPLLLLVILLLDAVIAQSFRPIANNVFHTSISYVLTKTRSSTLSLLVIRTTAGFSILHRMPLIHLLDRTIRPYRTSSRHPSVQSTSSSSLSLSGTLPGSRYLWTCRNFLASVSAETADIDYTYESITYAL